jgi:hypothetical protein
VDGTRGMLPLHATYNFQEQKNYYIEAHCSLLTGEKVMHRKLLCKASFGSTAVVLSVIFLALTQLLSGSPTEQE